MSIKQIPLKFMHQPFLKREDFIASSCNIEALAMVDAWQEWNNFAICIYGIKGSGKTHLAHIFAENVKLFDSAYPRVPIVKAVDIDLEDVHRLFEESKILVVEDIDDEDINQEAMFHLYNLYRNESGQILFTATTPPARTHFSLADLQSRLNSIPAIEIREADSELLSMLILKLFADRQVIISPDVVSYIINNAERSFTYVENLIEEVDAISISKKRAISIPIVKEAMLFISDDSQIELF